MATVISLSHAPFCAATTLIFLILTLLTCLCGLWFEGGGMREERQGRRRERWLDECVQVMISPECLHHLLSPACVHDVAFPECMWHVVVSPYQACTYQGCITSKGARSCRYRTLSHPCFFDGWLSDGASHGATECVGHIALGYTLHSTD